MKLLLSFFVSSFFLSVSVWNNDFEKAKIEASQNHKYILLNFCGSDWCGPCIKLKKDIFESADFEQYASDNLVLVRADFPRLKKNQLDAKQTAHNEALAEKYNPRANFLSVLIDANGKMIKSWDGYPASMSTLQLIHDIATAIDARK
ncbi:MAG: thioredoxin family protein [Spirosomataceae bacterium]